MIKPADKGSAIVLMDKQQYLLWANRQLHNNKHYTQLPLLIQNKTWILSLNHTKIMYLIEPNPPRPRQFYFLPKIPKAWTVPIEIPLGRPIVSDCGSESYNSTQYCHAHRKEGGHIC